MTNNEPCKIKEKPKAKQEIAVRVRARLSGAHLLQMQYFYEKSLLHVCLHRLS